MRAIWFFIKVWISVAIGLVLLRFVLEYWESIAEFLGKLF